MEYIDMRKISAGEAKQIRRQVVRLKEMGKSGKEIEEIVGVRQNRISEIWTAYQRDGEEALSRKKTGRKVGSGMILTPEEQEEIRGIVIETRPADHGMAGYLWTRNKVCELVRGKYKKGMTPESVSNYMKRWGLSCQRPAKRARKQNPKRV